MNVKKCDWCGALYVPTNGKSVFEIYKHSKLEKMDEIYGFGH